MLTLCAPTVHITIQYVVYTFLGSFFPCLVCQLKKNVANLCSINFIIEFNFAVFV